MTEGINGRTEGAALCLKGEADPKCQRLVPKRIVAPGELSPTELNGRLGDQTYSIQFTAPGETSVESGNRTSRAN
jgi:hypothetical protein